MPIEHKNKYILLSNPLELLLSLQNLFNQSRHLEDLLFLQPLSYAL